MYYWLRSWHSECFLLGIKLWYSIRIFTENVCNHVYRNLHTLR